MRWVEIYIPGRDVEFRKKAIEKEMRKIDLKPTRVTDSTLLYYLTSLSKLTGIFQIASKYNAKVRVYLGKKKDVKEDVGVFVI